MSARKTDMHRLQEMIRLHRLGRSDREISRLMRVGRDTVREQFRRLSSAGVLAGDVNELPRAEDLVEILGGEAEVKVVASSVDAWREQVEALLRLGATPTPIHDHLRLHAPNYTGTVSSIKRLCRRIRLEEGPRAEDVAIPVETVAGEVAQVDFAYVGRIYDPSRGVQRRGWAFSMVLGYSRYMFGDIVFDQSAQTWLTLHAQAFRALGGVPRVIVPDNLKAAVIRAAFAVDEDPTINRSYREFARHFGFQVDPTPPRSPEKKGKVERGLGYAKHNFFKTWSSVDIDEDRRQFARWIRDIANCRRHGTTSTIPSDVFEATEKPALLPLPAHEWDPVLWKRTRVHRDSHVQIDGAFYSAPWKTMSEELWARCTARSISLHRDDDTLVHTHARVARGQRRTVETHLPDHRVDLRHRSRGYWVELATKIGPEVVELIQRIFDSDDVLLQLRRVQAIVTHLQKFPASRARQAASRALHFGNFEYRSIKLILSKALDLEPLPSAQDRKWSVTSRFARPPLETISRKDSQHGIT